MPSQKWGVLYYDSHLTSMSGGCYYQKPNEYKSRRRVDLLTAVVRRPRRSMQVVSQPKEIIAVASSRTDLLCAGLDAEAPVVVRKRFDTL